MFGVEDLYACAQSIAERGVQSDGLDDDICLLSGRTELSALFERYDQVITI
nr:DsrE family protein [Pseudomonas viridiflava]